jgi:hypothetical protein
MKHVPKNGAFVETPDGYGKRGADKTCPPAKGQGEAGRDR